MADTYLASNDFPGDGSTTLRTISFKGNRPDAELGTVPYLSSGDVLAVQITPATSTTPEVETPLTVSYVGPNQFNITPACPVGTICRVYRATQDEYALVDYQSLQTVSEADLDLANRQTIFVVQEAHDLAQRAKADISQATTIAYDAQTVAQEAKDASEDAIAAAGIATGAANAAVVTANAASTKADAAVATANAAAATANGIAATANTALSQANAAVAAADAAVLTANGVDSKAQAALDNSNAAVSAASDAQDTADAAVASASAAVATANAVDGKAQSALDNSATAISTANAAAATANGMNSRVDTLEGSQATQDSAISALSTGKQNADATLTGLAALSIAANQVPIGSGTDTFSVLATGASGRTLMQAANEAAIRATMPATFTSGNLTGLSYQNANPNATATTLYAQLGLHRYPETFAQIADYNLDQGPILQRVLEIVGREGGGTVTLQPGKQYYVDTTIIIPTKVQLDMNGSTIKGNLAGGSTKTIFVSGYFNGSNVLVNNLSLADEQVILERIRITNGNFLEVYKGIHLRNCNMSCSLERLSFYNQVQAIHTERCFLMKYFDIQAQVGQAGTPTYRFSDGAHNSMVLDQVRAVTPWGFSFEGSGASIVLNCCDFEGGTMGFHFEGGPFYSVSFVGGYFEAVTGVLYDFISLTDESNFTWHGTYNFLIDTLMNSPTGGTVSGTFHEDNVLLGIGFNIGGHTYPMNVNLNSTNNRVKFRVRDAVSNGGVIPSYINITGNGAADVEQILLTNSASAPTSKSKVHAGIVPATRTGDIGSWPGSNSIPQCTHQAFNPASTSIIVLVDTKIAWQPKSMFVKFIFEVVANGVTDKVAGDLFGDIVHRADGLSATHNIIAVNNNGFLRFELYGYTGATAGAYTITGNVQLMA